MRSKKDKSVNPASRAHNYFAALFLAAAFIILIVLPLFQKGTFIDGELYKTVAYNYAINTSSFWNMKYTITCMPFFCEQPPLYPFLLGGFYKLFGSHYLIDRVFTLCLLLVFIVLIKKIIRELFLNTRFFYSLFLFMMVSVPVWCWSYVNQVIEPLVCVCIAIGLLSFLRYLSTKNAFYIFLFALSLYGSFLSKGFQSCFLIVLPVIYFLITRFSKPALYMMVASGSLLGLSLVFTLKLFQPAMQWFDCYYNARLVLTMQNIGHTTDSHVEIIVRFFTELIVPLILVTGLFTYLKVNKNYPLKFVFKNFASNKLAVALLITAFAGSFPYALSLVQRGFYLIPSFVCFILAILLGFKRYWLFFYAGCTRLISYQTARISIAFIFVGSLFYFCYAVNSYKRDENLLTDLKKITPYLSSKETVFIEGDLWNYFNLHSYLYRQKQINLSGNNQGQLFLIRNKNSADSVSGNYRNLHLKTKQLDLFIRVSPFGK